MKENKWIRLLAYVTGLVNQELLLENEYLAAENRMLRTPARPIVLIRSGKIHVWPKSASDSGAKLWP
jgi:hypothetical protein